MDPQRSPRDSESEQQVHDREFNRAAELSNKLQPDPQLIEGPAGRGRITAYVVAILVILGAVLYGLNSANREASNQSPTQITTQTNTSPPPAGNPAGTTTGSATNRPTPPQSGPTGTDIDRASQPPFAGQSK